MIYLFESYREFILHWIREAPRSGYGQLSKMAKALGVSSVFVTHVLQGERDLNPDQALASSGFLRLSERETEYFLLLVQEARAATRELRERLKSQRLKLRSEMQTLRNRVPNESSLTEAAKAEFYSHWHYSAIRLMTSVEGSGTVSALSSRLQIPMERVERIVGFLETHQLIVPSEHGWKLGPQLTHLEADSPFILSRQVQWRTKGFEAMAQGNELNLFYTSPMSLDEETYLEVREIMTQAIAKSLERVKLSPSTVLGCLNIDWFRLG